MTDEGPRPVLWIGLTEYGRRGDKEARQEHLEHVQEAVQDAVGDEYVVVAADDKTRLLDEDEIRGLVDDLQVLGIGGEA